MELRSNNVFTICPECGDEIQVDLQDLLGSGDADLYSTRVYCHACSVERAKAHPDSPFAEQLLKEG